MATLALAVVGSVEKAFDFEMGNSPQRMAVLIK